MTHEPHDTIADQTSAERAIEEQALGWHLRLDTCAASDWEQFTLWLEADPRHGAAFDAVCAVSDTLDHALAQMPDSGAPVAADNDNPPPAARRPWVGKRWIGGAIAACLVVAGSGWFAAQNLRADRYVIATGAGEQRELVMADGTRIALNGSTRLTLDRHDPRFAALDTGEAAFEVVHDPAHPFTLGLGAAEVRDLGTVFNVIREPGVDLVEVKEGRVEYAGGGQLVPLKPGQFLRAAQGSGELVVAPRRIEAIGSWRSGRLNYDMETFGALAQDVSRNLGVTVTADPELRDRRFSGTIRIDRDRARFFHALSVLLDTPVAGSGDHWRIAARKN